MNVFFCNTSFNWQAHLNAPLGVPIIRTGQMAEIIAIGKEEYEIIVPCPRCKVKNKFKNMA